MANIIVDKISEACNPYTKRKNTANVRLELFCDLCIVMDDFIEKDIIVNYDVVCNSSNNTPIILADGKLIATVVYYLKPDSDGTTINCSIVLNQPDPYAAYDYAMAGI